MISIRQLITRKRTKEDWSHPEYKINRKLDQKQTIWFSYLCLGQNVIILGLYLCSSFVHYPFKALITLTWLMIIATAVRISHNQINVIIENVPASTSKGLNSQSSISDINNHNQQTSISKPNDFIFIRNRKFTCKSSKEIKLSITLCI